MEASKITEAYVEVNPTAGKGKKQGNGAAQRKQAQFRAKKNQQFQAELTATLLKRLKVTDPTNLTAIKLQSSIVPARIPISFRGLPRYVHDLWARMKSIGTRPFATLATDANYRIFLKCAMFICEAKVAYAQMRCQQTPAFPLPSLEKFTEIQLRVLTSISKRLPYPLVIYVEAIGNFDANGQPVVPILLGTEPPSASGAVSFSPTDIAVLLNNLANPLPVTNIVAAIAQEIDEIPGINWVRDEIDVQPPAPQPTAPQPQAARVGVVSVAQDTRQFWNGAIPTIAEREVFNQIIASMDSKKGFNIQCDITTGDGSIVQAIRFPERFDPEEMETLYYTNTDIPTFEEQLAPALQLGYEYHGTTFSRFCGSYAECLKHGSASAEEARHAIIWTNSD